MRNCRMYYGAAADTLWFHLGSRFYSDVISAAADRSIDVAADMESETGESELAGILRGCHIKVVQKRRRLIVELNHRSYYQLPKQISIG